MTGGQQPPRWMPAQKNCGRQENHRQMDSKPNLSMTQTTLQFGESGTERISWMFLLSPFNSLHLNFNDPPSAFPARPRVLQSFQVSLHRDVQERDAAGFKD